MRTIKLLSWHSDLPAKAATLARKDLTIDSTQLVRTSEVIGELARLNPAALVLDLDKLPSNSREIALMLRTSKSARHIPILFAGELTSTTPDTLPEKFARLRSELPDIPYATWPNASKALATLLKHPPIKPPIVPAPRTYTTSLPQKLGIVSASSKSQDKPRQIALLAAPENFHSHLGDLPDTISFATRITLKTHLAICFIRSIADLSATLDLLTVRLPEGASAWIAYPKRTTAHQRDFNENDVRNLALASGLVDYKICSIDTAWSGMKFAHRKKEIS